MASTMKSRLLAGLALLPLASLASAQAVLGTGKLVAGLKVFSDWKNPSKRYVAPGTLQLVKANDGTPELSFLQMVYVGTAASGDQGTFRTRSILSFKVRLERPTPAQLEAVKAKILQDEGKAVTLTVLPLRGLQAQLNYVPAGDPAGSEAGNPPPIPIQGSGSIEESSPSSTPAPAAADVWVERTFTLVPDDASSQVLWGALKAGTCAFSLSYSVMGDATEEMNRVESSDPNMAQTTKPTSKVLTVFTDTLPIQIDPQRDKDKLKQIDINQSVPPGYASLRIFCVDFNNQLRPDLALKIVEIQAVGVNGKPLESRVAFSAKDADVSSASIKFKFAVDLRKAYRFRTVEVGADGSSTTSSWTTGKPWGQLLDVTSPPEKRPAKPAEDDGIGGNNKL